MNVWIEKTLVTGLADREAGDYSLGKALWSPQSDMRGANIYASMREVKIDDIVLHFINNEEFIGVSLVGAEYNQDFIGLEGTEWAKRKAYLVKLKNYEKLIDPINRKEIFDNAKYTDKLKDIEREDTVFYTSKLKLRQGAYLTKSPEELVNILNEIYLTKTGKSLPYVKFTNRSANITNEVMVKIIELDLLLSKKQIILYGPPGTGKTYNTRKMAISLLTLENTAEDIESIVRKDTIVGTEKKIWLFQANPKWYRLIDKLKHGSGKETWRVMRFKKEIKKGDIVVFWMAGENAGIYAVGEVLTDPKEMLADEETNKFSTPEYLKEFPIISKPCTRVWVKFNKILVDNPILKENIRSDKALRNLSVIKQPQGTNFRITEEQWEAIQKYLK